VSLPTDGAIVRVRQRHWLVQGTTPPAYRSHATAVHLACLDDDHAGQQLSVLWEHELDAAIVSTTPALLGPDATLDDPALFGAYLHAMRWNTVSSTDHRLLQAPFRAGIDLKAYQLAPLRKALELPRVSLFIADDVGLGKTIEAGLVLQELLLRQRIDRVLVVAPPTVTLQWQEELEQRFGLPFVVYDRDFVTARRRERGFGINPWTTHRHFIVSYALLRGSRARRGTQHLDLLLSSLGERAERSLLVLDECHHAAPAGGGSYTTDTRTTRAVRDLASRFEHRVFLSATPHNGHSTSFASLLHLLDPQRFTRGVPIQSARELAPVMVRRLKRHLREQVGGLPERLLVDHVVEQEPNAPEAFLGRLLAEYDGLYRAALADLPVAEQHARALVMVNLHKRLLSSVEAFHHTLNLHHRGARRALDAMKQLPLPVAPRREDDEERSEEELDEADDTFVTAASIDAGAQAAMLLTRMRAATIEHRDEPDARVRALAAWINTELAPGGRWNDRRVVVFTEYDHTLSWLMRTLPPLLHASAEGRFARYTGKLSDDNREALKAAFNSDPARHPLRVLLATDAAREGINLQAHCADLFHFDLPWNPSRIEQRNGRIDRVLQPSPQVRCHYFVLPQRPEDRVLTYLVRKLHLIREELGSLSEVISARLAARLEHGLRGLSEDQLEALTDPGDAARAAQAELEGTDAELLRDDLDVLRRQLERSRKVVDYRADHLQQVVHLGLRLATRTPANPAGTGLVAVHPPADPPAFTLPELDASWHGVIEPLRADPDPAMPYAVPPVRPVAFQGARRLDAETVQLHLGHPLVKRLLARFRAQGFAAHDLSRVTLLHNPRDATRRVLALARLSLFGHGATRLHEELLLVAARCTETGLELFGETGTETTRLALDEVLADSPRPHPDPACRNQALRRAPADFDALWPALQQQAEANEMSARNKLAARGEREAGDMVQILDRQEAAITDRLRLLPQLVFAMSTASREERDQVERDQRFLHTRLDELGKERTREPDRIRRSYAVVLRRVEPVGLAYLWPES
jgi:superfamily II DNA or RNA helicase